MFFSSAFTPSSVAPRGRMLTLASARSEPSSMFTSLMPSSRSVWRSCLRKATASAAFRRSGSVTISTSGVPPRLKSTTEPSAPARRPPAPAWTSLAASSSRCTRVIPISRSPSSTRKRKRPPVQTGSSNWEIWYAFGRSG